MSSTNLTPITKLLKNLSSLKSQSPLTQPIVLLTTGSMNPIHKQHYNNFEMAKRGLESQLQNVKVVAGYISPSQDLYVTAKLGKHAISIDERIKMCKLAVEESDWIDVDLWESKSIESNLGFINHHEVFHRLSKFLNENNEIGCNIKVFYLCGSDHFFKTHMINYTHIGCDKFVIIDREKDDSWIKLNENKLDRIFGKDAWKESIMFLHKEGNNNISSTAIRNKIDEWEDLCDPKVVKYIKDNEILTPSSNKFPLSKWPTSFSK